MTITSAPSAMVPVGQCLSHNERGDVLDILEHPNPHRYAGQRIFVVQRDDYVYLVPYIEDEESLDL